MKQLKPGQLCTIEKHVYRCKCCKKEIADPCIVCEEANHNYCILRKNGFDGVCMSIFGIENYPVLIK